jgi:alkyl hydroperoxide reductase subunit F
LEASTDFLGTLVARDECGRLRVNEAGATSCAGLFAAGDITAGGYTEHILVALGEGTKAGLGAHAYLRETPGWLKSQAHADH